MSIRYQSRVGVSDKLTHPRVMPSSRARGRNCCEINCKILKSNPDFAESGSAAPDVAWGAPLPFLLRPAWDHWLSWKSLLLHCLSWNRPSLKEWGCRAPCLNDLEIPASRFELSSPTSLFKPIGSALAIWLPRPLHPPTRDFSMSQ